MYDKICDIWRKLWSFKGCFMSFLFFFFVIFLLWFAPKLVVDNGWERLTHYPEDSYKNLEKEANYIIESKDFDTDYNLHIQTYNNFTNYLCFDLSDDSATVTVEVENYGEPKEVIDITRDFPSASSFLWSHCLAIFVLCWAFSLFALLILLVISCLLRFLAWLAYKMTS